MNATEDLFEAVGISHIAVALHHFSMNDMHGAPHHPLLNIDLQFVKRSKMVYQQATMPDNFSVTVSDDKVFEYACCVLSAAMLMYEL